jgi:hypothetical protein
LLGQRQYVLADNEVNPTARTDVGEVVRLDGVGSSDPLEVELGSVGGPGRRNQGVAAALNRGCGMSGGQSATITNGCPALMRPLNFIRWATRPGMVRASPGGATCI